MELRLYKSKKPSAPKAGTVDLNSYALVYADKHCPLNEDYADEGELANAAEFIVSINGHAVNEGDVLSLSGKLFVKTKDGYKRLANVLQNIIATRGHAHPNVAGMTRDLYTINDITAK